MITKEQKEYAENKYESRLREPVWCGCINGHCMLNAMTDGFDKDYHICWRQEDPNFNDVTDEDGLPF